MTTCDWPIDYAACVLPEGFSEDKAQFESIAVEFLWLWSDRQFGLCEVTLRPCLDCHGGPPSTFYGGGPRVSSPFFDTYSPRCSYLGPSVIKLPGRVDSISKVEIKGEVLDSSEYQVDNHSLLVRRDGKKWPKRSRNQDDFVVTYKVGTPVPVGGQMAAGRLAVEFYKAHCGDKSCALPQRVQSITRQGVTMTVLDSFEDIDTGHTGIWAIDSWIASVTKPRSPSTVHSVDVSPYAQRKTTWP